MDIRELSEALRRFADERDWQQFHTPENLAKSVAIEAGELLECFQWGGAYDRHAVSDEIADVVTYCVMLSDAIGIDMMAEIERKLAENAAKYPADRCRGSSAKYTAYAK